MKQMIACLFLSLLWFIDAPAEDFSFGFDEPSVEVNSFRQEQCLNGFWRFCPLLPDEKVSDTPPEDGTGWGYFKVPGVWPERLSKAAPFVPMFADQARTDSKNWHTAWYSREILIPAQCAGSNILLDIGIVQTRAMVYLDSVRVGEIVFPGGKLDLTKHIKPGIRQRLDLRVSAVPLSQDHYIVMDGNNASAVAAKVKNKGITSDVFLQIVPSTRIGNAHYITSYRNKTLTVSCELIGMKEEKKYAIEAVILDKEGTRKKQFTRDSFDISKTNNGWIESVFRWDNPDMWDIDSPQNIYRAVLTLKENDHPTDVTLPETFGFREFWIDGQNYILNGKVIHLRAYHLDNYNSVWLADRASKQWALKAYQRLKELGFNFTISKNYNFAEGEMNYLQGSFEAADECGHLHSMSLPHPWQFKEMTDPENAEKFEKMTRYLVQRYWNHPSLVMYVTNHNSGGAWGDQNPLRVGGEYKRANNEDEVKLKEQARANFLVAQNVVEKLDPTRPVYSHASGSLGGQYSLNMYLNWAPIQERSDWLEHYYEQGKYPLSLVEWGMPHNASFSSFRGPGFIWGAKAVMTLWDAEYAANLYGDSVARWTPERIKLLDKMIQLGNDKIRWWDLVSNGRYLPDVIRVQADYFADNLRCLRAWNIGFLLPWDSYAFYDKNDGNFPPVENPKRYEKLNKPGIVPDYSHWGDYILSAHDSQYGLSPVGKVIQKWNQPVIAWIGGENVFTSKEHIFRPGQVVRKQLVILNDRRKPVECKYTFGLNLADSQVASGTVVIEPGARALLPVSVRLPDQICSGSFVLCATFSFGENVKLTDSFDIDVIAEPVSETEETVALFDPEKKTSALLSTLGINYVFVEHDSDLSQFQLLVLGRNALNKTDNNIMCPDLTAVRDGLNVLVLEQNTSVLKRIGFRYQEYGLRRLFIRNKKHQVLMNIPEAALHDWRGASTILPAYLDYDQYYRPTWDWCGFENSRVWRAGNRGNVASVLIEKPSLGNFSPLLDGGFALQYAPILEYCEGKGRILFIQADVTGRTSEEPAAEILVHKAVDYLVNEPDPIMKKVGIIGGAEFTKWLHRMNVENIVSDHIVTDLDSAEVILVGKGASATPDLTPYLKKGKTVILLGVPAQQAKKLIPGQLFDIKKNAPSMIAKLDQAVFRSINNMDAAFQTRLSYTTMDGQEICAKSIDAGTLVFVGVTPQMLDYQKLFRLRSSYRRRAFLVSQILRNVGVSLKSDLLQCLSGFDNEIEGRNRYYQQTAISEDDPYRYYHW